MIFYGNKCLLVSDNTYVYGDLCDEFLHASKAKICIVDKMKFGDTWVNLIMIDSIFTTLDESVRGFIINHEMGHVKYNHMDKPCSRGIKNAFKQEFEADAYATSINGKRNAIYALYNLMKYSSVLGKFELIVRMLYIAINKL